MSNPVQSENKKFYVNKLQRISLSTLVFIFLIYINRNVLIYRNIINFLDTEQIQAVIIDKKEAGRRSHLTGYFTYYYEFRVNGKYYTNPSYDEKYKIGDSVRVAFSKKYPFINKITNQ